MIFAGDSWPGGSVDPRAVRAGEPYQRAESDSVFASVCEFGGWPRVPIRVAAGAGDRFFPASFQQTVAKNRLGIDPDLLPGGHLNALSEPAALNRLPDHVHHLTRPQQPQIQQRWPTEAERKPVMASPLNE
jgi:hypothetical protein